MTTYPYLKLLSSQPLLAAETPGSYTYITERHIQAMWMEQKYFHTLTTHSGQTIEVVSPGIWNHGPGPDFLKAHLLVEGQDLKGDIEIHLNAEDWAHHNHGLNLNYDRVILHVYLWKTKTLSPVKTSEEKEIMQLCVEDHLTIDPSQITRLFDLDLYPYRKFVGSGRCAQALFSKLSESKIRDLLKQAADWRLKQKREFIQEKTGDRALFLSTGIAMALGYKKKYTNFFKIVSLAL